jgi:PTS hybrid protein
LVGLLIVSHSHKIAEGVKDLAEQVAGSRVLIAAVGGASDGALGTSADQIRNAAEQLSSTDGVLVLLDMGSAVLSTEMALENFDHPYLLSNAPLVEGALLAAVEAATGADLQQTAAAAEQARELRKVYT